MKKENLIKEIEKIKKEKNVVILSHYYQYPEVQDIADYVGDSLALSKVATTTKADIILFCGVHFMAETAKILSPEKKVLLPDQEAGCPMADMITAKNVQEYKDNNPNAKVMCYVNSTAEVKALSDVCVTSTNAQKVASNFKNQQMLYVPDQNLGHYLNQQIEGLNLELWPGHCCIHNNLKIDEVNQMKKKYPSAKLIVHPESNPDVVEMADYVGSTQQLIDFTKTDNNQLYIVGTENGVLHEMKKHSPNKEFYVLSENLNCRTMKMITLEKVYESLRDEKYEINVEKEVIINAKKALDLMLELS